MNKKITGMLVLIMFLGALFIPYQKMSYKDGGTRIWNALTYQYVHFKTLEGCNEMKLIFGQTKRDYEYFHQKLCIKNIKKILKESGTNIGIDKGDNINQVKLYKNHAAGIFEGDSSLSFDNQDAQKIRRSLELRSDNFNHNWKNQKLFPEIKHTPYRLETKHDAEGNTFYVIKKDGKTIYESGKTPFIVDEPLKNFVVQDDNRWLLYDENTPILSGDKDVMTYSTPTKFIYNGREIDYVEVFGLQNIESKVLYFFIEKEGEKIKFSYNGEVYQTNFDNIIHDKCCEPAAYNMKFSNDGRITFWGVKEEKLSYNELILPGSSFDQKMQNL